MYLQIDFLLFTWDRAVIKFFSRASDICQFQFCLELYIPIISPFLSFFGTLNFFFFLILKTTVNLDHDKITAFQIHFIFHSEKRIVYFCCKKFVLFNHENYNFILSKLNYSLIPIFLQAPFDWKATEIEKIPYYFRP